jgi:hypothetical protein
MSGLPGDLTQHAERHVSSRKSSIPAYPEQRLEVPASDESKLRLRATIDLIDLTE